MRNLSFMTFNPGDGSIVYTKGLVELLTNRISISIAYANKVYIKISSSKIFIGLPDKRGCMLTRFAIGIIKIKEYIFVFLIQYFK